MYNATTSASFFFFVLIPSAGFFRLKEHPLSRHLFKRAMFGVPILEIYGEIVLIKSVKQRAAPTCLYQFVLKSSNFPSKIGKPLSQDTLRFILINKMITAMLKYYMIVTFLKVVKVSSVLVLCFSHFDNKSKI